MRIFLFTILASLSGNSVAGQAIQKNGTIILTDIENESDDTQSLVRLLLYSNEIDIEGIVKVIVTIKTK